MSSVGVVTKEQVFSGFAHRHMRTFTASLRHDLALCARSSPMVHSLGSEAALARIYGRKQTGRSAQMCKVLCCKLYY